MKIIPGNDKQLCSFKSISIPFTETQELILNKLNKKELESLTDIFERESANPVNAIIYNDNKFLLKAKIMCKYKLDNFKENFMQRPIIESKLSFIKRVANVIHKYNESICKTQ